MSHAGTALVSQVADKLGLTGALSIGLAGIKQRRRGHDQGRVVRDLAPMLTDGDECVSDSGAVRSMAYGWRLSRSRTTCSSGPKRYAGTASSPTPSRNGPLPAAARRRPPRVPRTRRQLCLQGDWPWAAGARHGLQEAQTASSCRRLNAGGPTPPPSSPADQRRRSPLPANTQPTMPKSPEHPADGHRPASNLHPASVTSSSHPSPGYCTIRLACTSTTLSIASDSRASMRTVGVPGLAPMWGRALASTVSGSCLLV